MDPKTVQALEAQRDAQLRERERRSLAEQEQSTFATHTAVIRNLEAEVLRLQGELSKTISLDEHNATIAKRDATISSLEAMLKRALKPVSRRVRQSTSEKALQARFDAYKVDADKTVAKLTDEVSNLELLCAGLDAQVKAVTAEANLWRSRLDAQWARDESTAPPPAASALPVCRSSRVKQPQARSSRGTSMSAAVPRASVATRQSNVRVPVRSVALVQPSASATLATPIAVPVAVPLLPPPVSGSNACPPSGRSYSSLSSIGDGGDATSVTDDFLAACIDSAVSASARSQSPPRDGSRSDLPHGPGDQDDPSGEDLSLDELVQLQDLGEPDLEEDVDLAVLLGFASICDMSSMLRVLVAGANQ